MGAANGPEHAGLLEALTDDRAATGLDHTGSDEKSPTAEQGVLHLPLVFLEIPELFDGFLALASSFWKPRVDRSGESVDIAEIEPRKPFVLLARRLTQSG